MTAKTKKLQNDPANVVAEMIEGLVGAHPALLGLAGETGRVVVALEGPREGKVGIVVGGGSGHEPAFVGYVGRGLADAAAIGNVFASPSPAPIAEAARAVDGGAGILLLYGNYSGDVMNFDMAAETLGGEWIEVRTVLVTDDVASAPRERMAERRGIAGDFFVFKIAGACADRMLALDAVVAAAEKANGATFTMGVALGPCSLPQTCRPNFTIGEGEMEIGMGIHGEAGIRRAPLESADTVTDALMDAILAEAGLVSGDRVAVLVNGLGSTAQMELYVLFRRVKQILDGLGVAIHRSFVGEYVTSLEMAGASITLLKLDDELAELLDHPCETPALRVGSAPPAAPHAQRHRPAASAPRVEAPAAPEILPEDAPDGDLRAPGLLRMIRAVRAAMDTQSAHLCELDGVVGDGDHGVAMATGWAAAERAAGEAGEDATILDLCRRVADAFLTAVGASSGPLLASAFAAAGESARGRRGLDPAATARFIAALGQGAAERGKARPGDRTMVDALAPAAERATQAAEAGASVAGVLEAAAEGANEGARATAAMLATKGRTAKLGERALGHVDPGAASTAIMLEAMARAQLDPPIG